MLKTRLRDAELSYNSIRVERDKLLKVSSDLKIKLNQSEKRSEMSISVRSPRA
jgi:hypothetical protein